MSKLMQKYEELSVRVYDTHVAWWEAVDSFVKFWNTNCKVLGREDKEKCRQIAMILEASANYDDFMADLAENANANLS